MLSKERLRRLAALGIFAYQTFLVDAWPDGVKTDGDRVVYAMLNHCKHGVLELGPQYAVTMARWAYLGMALERVIDKGMKDSPLDLYGGQHHAYDVAPAGVEPETELEWLLRVAYDDFFYGFEGRAHFQSDWVVISQSSAKYALEELGE